MSEFKLYYEATSCGAANFITASIAGLTFDSEQVDIGPAKKTASGADYLAINPAGTVPTIVLPCGYSLTETTTCLAYLADRNPKAGLAPAPGSPERYIFLNKLAFVHSMMHKAHVPLFGGATGENREKAVANIIKQHKYFVDSVIGEGEYAMGGDQPTTIDIYAYIVMTWSGCVDIPLAEKAPKAAAWMEKIAALPGVVAAKEEMAAAPKP